MKTQRRIVTCIVAFAAGTVLIGGCGAKSSTNVPAALCTDGGAGAGAVGAAGAGGGGSGSGGSSGGTPGGGTSGATAGAAGGAGGASSGRGGAAGSTGTAGTGGTAGMIGAAGTGGVAGAAGTAGASGRGGASGTAGVSGAAGTSGTAGTNGGAGGTASTGAGGTAGAGTGTGGAGGATCPIKTGGALCSGVPRFTGTQVVDGSGDDFCDVPATVFPIKDGVQLDGNKPPPILDVLFARVAWDGAGIHAHFHVDDAEVMSGDAIEFDIGGQFPLAGFFDGVSTDVGLTAIGLVVGGTSTTLGFPVTFPAVADMTYQGNQTVCVPMPCTSPPRGLVSFGQPLVAPARWAHRIVPGGYEFELFLPWVVLGRTTAPTVGTAIAADIALTARSQRLTARAYLAINPLPNGSSSQCQTTRIGTTTIADPSCDDRGWCAPTLQ